MVLFSAKKNKKKSRFSAGFTLIEVIASLVLMGLLLPVAGFGLLHVVEGYMFSRENSVMTQKAQLAMARMRLEIIGLAVVDGATDSEFLRLQNVDGTSRTFGFNDKLFTIQVLRGSEHYASGDILVDNVNALALKYYSGATECVDASCTGDNSANLTMVEISFTLNRSDGTSMEFTTRVAPRNNKNTGGVPSIPSL